METRTHWLFDAVEGVIALWNRVRHADLDLEDKLPTINQIKLADYLVIGSSGDDSSAVQLTYRLKESGLREAFPDSSSWFRAFVDTVVNEYERGVAAKDIAAGLKFRAITAHL